VETDGCWRDGAVEQVKERLLRGTVDNLQQPKAENRYQDQPVPNTGLDMPEFMDRQKGNESVKPNSDRDHGELYRVAALNERCGLKRRIPARYKRTAGEQK